MIFFNQGMLLLGSNHFLISIYVVGSKLQAHVTSTKQLQPHPLETPIFLSSKWLAIGDLRCYGRGIVNFADNYLLRSHIPLRSCLVGLRLWSDNVNWNSCIRVTANHRASYFSNNAGSFPTNPAEPLHNFLIPQGSVGANYRTANSLEPARSQTWWQCEKCALLAMGSCIFAA